MVRKLWKHELPALAKMSTRVMKASPSVIQFLVTVLTFTGLLVADHCRLSSTVKA